MININTKSVSLDAQTTVANLSPIGCREPVQGFSGELRTLEETDEFGSPEQTRKPVWFFLTPEKEPFLRVCTFWKRNVNGCYALRCTRTGTVDD